MKVLCVYYSWKGHTAKVAGRLADLLHTEAVRIEPVKEPGIARQAFKAMLGMSSAIKPVNADLADIDVLVLACPVWAGKVPPYVNQYIQNLTRCEEKRCFVLVEMGGSGAEKAIAHLKSRLESKGMDLAGSTWTIEKDVDADAVSDRLVEFCGKIHGNREENIPGM